MFKIESDTRRLKHDVLTRVAELAYQGKLNSETIDEIPFEIIPGRQPHFRCCVYKEREIIHQRVRLAMGKMPNGMQPTTAAVTVIPAACEGCPIQRYTVTENCQKCLAKKCMAACPFGAISMSGRGAWIDPNKCRECGRCAAACPYNAIADLVRPCRKACPVGAIEIGDEKLADIDQEKCISCGACMQACPFGAISDRAQILPIIEDMRAGRHLVAMIAPALEGQFGANVTMGQLRNAVKALGFDAVYEVGLGADAVSMSEAEELLEHLKAGLKMTTSCCPAFVNMIRKHFPRLQPHVSTTVSPMAALSRWLREKYPQHKVVFIGPCVAKKTEEIEGGPDYVLTTEEIVALLDARKIDPEQMEDAEQEASAYGKGFASSGGVTGAVMKAIAEMEGEVPAISAQRCNGAAECKKALQLLQAGKFDLDFIEGMACEGGCMYGPANMLSERLYTQARKKLLSRADDRGVVQNARDQGFDKIHMHREAKRARSLRRRGGRAARPFFMKKGGNRNVLYALRRRPARGRQVLHGLRPAGRRTARKGRRTRGFARVFALPRPGRGARRRARDLRRGSLRLAVLQHPHVRGPSQDEAVLLPARDGGADGAQAQAFAEACVQRALANYPGLPRGFQNGVVIYPVLCQQRATPGALEYVRALPKNHFAAFACPMLFEYATGNLYYGTELPVWGFAMVGGIRKAGAALLKP